MKSKEHFQALQKSRHAKQLIFGSFFVLLVIAGWFLPLIGYFIPLCMVAGVGMATARGRQWCNWYCPRGSFADTFLKALSPGRRIPSWLRGLPVRVAVLAFLMAMLTVQILRLWPDFFAIGGFFIILLTVTTVVGIVLAMTIHQRSWCYVCPIGSLSNWVGKARHTLSMNRETCVGCKLCAKACPMQLSPMTMKEEKAMPYGGDCLKCGLCAATCPTGSLSFPSRGK